MQKAWSTQEDGARPPHPIEIYSSFLTPYDEMRRACSFQSRCEHRRHCPLGDRRTIAARAAC